MKPVTPYGKADDLAYQNERLVQALRRERATLAIERARIQAVRNVLGTWATYCQTEQTARALSDIRRALDG